MNAMNKQKQTKEQKIHPFLFLILIFSLGLISVRLWAMWKEDMSSQQLQDVVKSVDIENLLEGSTSSDKTDMAKILKQFSHDTENNLASQILEAKALNAAGPANINEASTTQNASNSTVNNASTPADPNTSPDTVTLALRDIFIFQGDNGVEKWRLKADWATLRQTSSVLTIHQPTLLYNTGEQEQTAHNPTQAIPKTHKNKNAKIVNIADLKIDIAEKKENKQKAFFKNSKDMLSITAKKGIVFDNNTKIHLAKNVRIKQEDNYAEGDTLNYDDNTRIAKFPSLAKFTGENIKGNARVLSWNLNKNILVGNKGVNVTWFPSPEEKTEEKKIGMF